MKLKLNATLSTVNETSERTVPPRSVGGARNSFHARSTIVSGAALDKIDYAGKMCEQMYEVYLEETKLGHTNPFTIAYDS